jgi:hypothetical protein
VSSVSAVCVVAARVVFEGAGGVLR